MSKPIIKTYAYAFNNRQTCQLGFRADQNGVQCIASHHEHDIAMLKAIIAELERLDAGEGVG